jgi:AraC family transcriptional regulator, arabinose operon regulatory protein
MPIDYRSAGWVERATELLERHRPVPSQPCRRVTCDPDWSWQPAIPDYDLFLIQGGRGGARFDDADYRLAAGTLLVLRPGEPGELWQDPTDRLTVSYCHFDFAGRRPEDSSLPNRYLPLPDATVAGHLLARLIRCVRDPHPLRAVDAAATLRSLLVEVYLQDARAHGESTGLIDPRVQAVRDRILDDPRVEITLASAARLVGLTAKHFSRLFRDGVGVNFREFVVQARLDHAHGLVTETSLSLSQIARSLGYRDAFSFSRQYRRRFGQPPSSARRQHEPAIRT